jgi:glycosyltransferase involved in cell wall biosynthesis
MSEPVKIMILQTRHIESISYLTAELVRAFPPEKYQVTLVYLESGELSASDALAHNCVFLNLSKTDYKGLRLKAMRKLKPFLETNHFDVVIANMFKPVHLLLQLRRSVSASLCIGIIHAFGEFDRFGRRWMIRTLLDSRWRLIGVSEPVRQYLIASRCGLNAGNTFAINNAIDYSSTVAKAMCRDDARTALGLPANGFVYGTVGRCVEGKRHLELIAAFQQVAQQRENVFLVILGDGPLLIELRSYVIKANLQGKVFLPGHVTDAYRYLRALDVFLFPSTSEGFGLALLEAMALSVPVIVNHVEPLVSIVGEQGVAIDAANIDALAGAMVHHHQMPETELHSRGLYHCQRVQQFYDIAYYRSQYRKVVEDHLASASYAG